jgi:hypothetical protein
VDILHGVSRCSFQERRRLWDFVVRENPCHENCLWHNLGRGRSAGQNDKRCKTILVQPGRVASASLRQRLLIGTEDQSYICLRRLILAKKKLGRFGVGHERDASKVIASSIVSWGVVAIVLVRFKCRSVF